MPDDRRHAVIVFTDTGLAYGSRPPVLENLSIRFEPGSFTALTGPNGSGKSTLAYLAKGLLTPTSGTVTVDGVSGDDPGARDFFLGRVGLVFQNPDDAIVATTVERELAFGLENMGLPPDEIGRRLDDGLERFSLARHRYANPNHLSGGEKQRLALAAVMLMEPSHLVLDEPTSLLDPWSRGPILHLIREQADRGMTVVYITQFPEEARHADRLVVLDRGRISHDGSPVSPAASTSARETPAKKHRQNAPGGVSPRTGGGTAPVLRLEGIGHTYESGTPYKVRALDGIDAVFRPGTATVVMGHSGSGKSTLLEICAGLTAPAAGTVVYDENALRAMAFQFPEEQMCAETVGEYVAFGSVNLGLDGETCRRRTTGALETVGLDPETFAGRDPFTLSGGEKRRAALAGVIAMHPDILVLDEPTAGLDGAGVDLVASFLSSYVAGGGCCIFSSHDTGLASRLADRALVLDSGRLETSGTCDEVVRTSPLLLRLGNAPAE